MFENESILDKILQSKQMNEAYQFKPDEIIENFLKHLSIKEREILAKRFGLNGHEPHTLEQIGEKHQITRERIRQIQNAAVKKIKEASAIKESIEYIHQTVNRLLLEYGGIMEDTHFLENLLNYSNKSSSVKRATEFIVSQLLNEKIERVKKSEKLLTGWKLKSTNVDIVHEILDEIERIIVQKNDLIEINELLEIFKKSDFFSQKKSDFVTYGITDFEETDGTKMDLILESYLKISKRINKNILDKWGLTSWSTITPKRMGDKIYLVLTKIQKPLHFTDIAKLINETSFDKKIAYPATIHNELILDDRYVLVGRGIYALKEWGYKSGTVSEVIHEILQSSPTPLTKREILDEVMKRRMVKKSTVYLALSNKNKFTKANDRYSLKAKN